MKQRKYLVMYLGSPLRALLLRRSFLLYWCIFDIVPLLQSPSFVLCLEVFVLGGKNFDASYAALNQKDTLCTLLLFFFFQKRKENTIFLAFCNKKTWSFMSFLHAKVMCIGLLHCRLGEHSDLWKVMSYYEGSTQVWVSKQAPTSRNVELMPTVKKLPKLVKKWMPKRCQAAKILSGRGKT